MSTSVQEEKGLLLKKWSLASKNVTPVTRHLVDMESFHPWVAFL